MLGVRPRGGLDSPGTNNKRQELDCAFHQVTVLHRVQSCTYHVFTNRLCPEHPETLSWQPRCPDEG